MVLDTSAIMALLLQEAQAPEIDELLGSTGGPISLSAANQLELMIVVESRVGPAGVLIADELLSRFRIHIEAVTSDVAQLAVSGWRRFGKGRHPAALNFGDCFSYGLAMARSEPLLFVGDDLSRTDVQPVLLP